MKIEFAQGVYAGLARAGYKSETGEFSGNFRFAREVLPDASSHKLTIVRNGMNPELAAFSVYLKVAGVEFLRGTANSYQLRTGETAK